MSEFIVSLFALVVLLALVAAIVTSPSPADIPRHFGTWLGALIFACVVLGLAYRVAVLGGALI